MITIREALPNEFNLIQDIARRTWPVAYREILSNAQLEYMLTKFYSLEALNKNAHDGHQFVLAFEEAKAVAFAAFELDHQALHTHIHKIYVLPEAQGKSVGKELMAHIEKGALRAKQSALTLNVNRENPAQYFYNKLGFTTAETIDIEIGQGYLMQDYIMKKNLWFR